MVKLFSVREKKVKSGDLSNNQSSENNRAENGNQAIASGNRATEQTQAVEQCEESCEIKCDCIKKENCFVPIDDKGKKPPTKQKKGKLAITIACIAVVLIAAITTISCCCVKRISENVGKKAYYGREDLKSVLFPTG